MLVFIPVSEGLMDRLGLNMEDLVPFDLSYEILPPGALFPEAEEDAAEPAAAAPGPHVVR